MIENTFEFFKENGNNIIISLIVGFVFFVLGPIGLWFSKKKVRREKTIKAKENLLDIVEGMLVNSENINESRLLSLFYAISRENSIDLEAENDIEDLLEDLVLRFERSKHLSPEEKDKYVLKIETLQKKLFSEPEEEQIEETRDIPKTYKNLFEELEINLEKKEIDKAKKNVEQLKEKLIYKKSVFPKLFNFYFRFYQKNPLAFFIAIVITLIIYWYLIKYLFDI